MKHEPSDAPAAPGYWLYETTGRLAEAVHRYLLGEELSLEDIAYLRAYFRRWVASPAWLGPGIEGLRDMIGSIRNRAQIETWLRKADEEGIDPL